MQENLKKTGFRKVKDKVVSYLSPKLLIRHKPTKIEYTVAKIILKKGKPCIIAYRYYSNPNKNKKVFITILEKEFNKYETV
jgi:hypothetical protein